MATTAKGVVLQFGMVTAIVNVETAIESETALTTLCEGNAAKQHAPGKITMQRFCAACDATVAYADMKKGRQVGDGYVVMEQDEISDIKTASFGATKKLLGITPHDATEVFESTLQGEKVYYLAPADGGQIPAYSMLLDATLRHPEYAFMGLWTPRTKTAMFQLKPFQDKVLVLEERVDPTMVRTVPSVTITPTDVVIQAQFDALLPIMAKPFDPAVYADTFKAELDKMIASREAVTALPQVVVPGVKATPKTANGGVDLSAALAAMLGAAAPVTTKAAPVKRTRKAKSA